MGGADRQRRDAGGEVLELQLDAERVAELAHDHVAALQQPVPVDRLHDAGGRALGLLGLAGELRLVAAERQDRGTRLGGPGGGGREQERESAENRGGGRTHAHSIAPLRHRRQLSGTTTLNVFSAMSLPSWTSCFVQTPSAISQR